MKWITSSKLGFRLLFRFDDSVNRSCNAIAGRSLKKYSSGKNHEIKVTHPERCIKFPSKGLTITTEKNKIAQLCDADKSMLSNTYRLSMFLCLFRKQTKQTPWEQVETGFEYEDEIFNCDQSNESSVLYKVPFIFSCSWKF